MLEQAWPQLRAVSSEAAAVEIVVQINGKVRGKVSVASALRGNEDAVRAAILASDVGRRWITPDAVVAKCFLVANKNLINIVLQK